MLLSAVLHLRPLSPGALHADQGRALMKEFLDWVKQANSSMFDELHKPDDTRPYTVSGLRGNAVRAGDYLLLNPDQVLWWRVTSLDDALSDLIQHIFENRLPATINISHKPFHILKATVDPNQHEWAGIATYDELDSNPDSSPELIQVEFASPTTFRSDGKNQPFPLPRYLANQWLQKWNKYSKKEPIPDQIIDYADACLAVSRYEICSQDVQHGKATYIGFTGFCRYRILEYHPFWTGKLLSLARFSFYCGTGAKTSFGLGQTRVIGA